MRYDNPIKLIAEAYPNDIASWVTGFPLKGRTLEATELPSAPIRADFLFRDETNRKVVHVEFQTAPDRDIPLRMLDYWVRLKRRYPDYDSMQYVVYLRPTNSKYVKQSGLKLPNLTYTFNTIRLWEVPSHELMSNNTGLLPFAVLGKCSDREQMLKQVLNKLDLLPDSEKKDILMAATEVFSELVLEDKKVDFEVLRGARLYARNYTESFEEGMKIGRGEGIRIGWGEGRAETLREVALRMLEGHCPLEEIVRITNLSLEQIQELKNNIQPEVERMNIYTKSEPEREIELD